MGNVPRKNHVNCGLDPDKGVDAGFLLITFKTAYRLGIYAGGFSFIYLDS